LTTKENIYEIPEQLSLVLAEPKQPTKPLIIRDM